MPLPAVTAINLLERATDETLAGREDRVTRRRARRDARPTSSTAAPAWKRVLHPLRSLTAAVGGRGI